MEIKNIQKRDKAEERSKLEEELAKLRAKLEVCQKEFDDLDTELSNEEKNLDILINDHSEKVSEIADGINSLFSNKEELDGILEMHRHIDEQKSHVDETDDESDEETEARDQNG